jgi:hypothetical protein
MQSGRGPQCYLWATYEPPFNPLWSAFKPHETPAAPLWTFEQPMNKHGFFFFPARNYPKRGWELVPKGGHCGMGMEGPRKGICGRRIWWCCTWAMCHNSCLNFLSPRVAEATGRQKQKCTCVTSHACPSLKFPPAQFQRLKLMLSSSEKWLWGMGDYPNTYSCLALP